MSEHGSQINGNEQWMFRRANKWSMILILTRNSEP
jgi:hypothetical protein